MIAKSLIAAAAIATTMALVPAQQANAGVEIDINVGIPGYYPGYYDPIYDPGFGAISCKKGKKILDFQKGYNNVQAVDCSLPGYKYTAWKGGNKWLVKMNGNGQVTGKSMLF